MKIIKRRVLNNMGVHDRLCVNKILNLSDTDDGPRAII